MQMQIVDEIIINQLNLFETQTNKLLNCAHEKLLIFGATRASGKHFELIQKT